MINYYMLLEGTLAKSFALCVCVCVCDSEHMNIGTYIYMKYEHI